MRGFEEHIQSPSPQVGGGSDDFVIAAICENKAREVGLAVFELGTSVLYLQQYVENSFTYTISL